MLYKIRQTLWVVALLGAYDVFQNGGKDGCPLGSYSNVEIIKSKASVSQLANTNVK